MKPLISVIVPVYNAEKYIEKCALSIMNQDYSNLEIIFVNDGSIDKSGEILDELKSKDKRIQVFHITNGGVGHATNYGIDRMHGEFVLFADNDDWLESNMISYLYEKITNHKLEVAICSGFDDYENTEISKVVQRGKNKFFSGKSAIKDVLTNHKYTHEAIMMKLFRKNLFEEFRLVEGKIYTDVDAFIRMFVRINRVGFFNKPLYHYLIREGSICHSGYKKYSIQQVQAYAENRSYLNKIYPDLTKYLDYYIYSMSAINWMKLVLMGEPAEFKDDIIYYEDKMLKFKPYFNIKKINTFCFYLAYKASSKMTKNFILKNQKLISKYLGVSI